MPTRWRSFPGEAGIDVCIFNISRNIVGIKGPRTLIHSCFLIPERFFKPSDTSPFALMEAEDHWRLVGESSNVNPFGRVKLF
jgi:hypothetical protein